MEKRLKTPDLFKFPFFEAICWFVAKNLLETLKGNPYFVLRGIHVSAPPLPPPSLIMEKIILLCEQRKLLRLKKQT